MEQEAFHPLATERIGKLLPRYAIPSILSLLISSLYNIVDQIFVGNGVGYLGNCATSILFPLTVIGLAVALLIGDGTAAHLSLCQGRNQTEEFHVCLGNGLLLGAMLSILYMIFFFLFTDQLLTAFGATEATLPYAREYGVVIFMGMPFFIISNLLSGVIRADGSPQISMLAMTAGAVFNVIFDPIFIFGFHMGVLGAAVATILGQLLSCVIALLYLRNSKTFRLHLKSFRPKLGAVLQALPLGISSFLTQAAIVITSGVSNMLLVKYGMDSVYGPDIPIAVMGIVMKVFAIVISIAIGLAVGAQPIIGFNYSAGNYKRVRDTFKLMITLTVAVAIAATIIFECFPHVLIGIFGNEGESYVTFAVLCFRVYLCLILFTCVQKSAGVFLQAIGKPIQSILVSVSRDLLFQFPAMLIMSSYWGILGILWAAPVADSLAFVVTLIFIVIQMKNLTEKGEKEA